MLPDCRRREDHLPRSSVNNMIGIQDVLASHNEPRTQRTSNTTNLEHNEPRTQRTSNTTTGVQMTGSDQLQGRPTVAVVGGGYGGVTVAKALDETMDVVLVEPRDAFMHNVAALRALVDPSWLPRIYFPYDKLLANGRVLRDRAPLA